MDEFLSISQGECGMKSGDVPEVKKGYLAQVVDVVLKGQLGVKPDAQVADC